MLRQFFISSQIVLIAGSMQGVLAQTAPPREIDNHAGIFFFCKPLANEAWTTRACAEVGTKMAAMAAEAKKPIVIMKIGDTRDKYPELARAAGFDSSRALWVLLTIDPHAQIKGQWELAARADGHHTPSTTGTPQTITYSKRATAMSAGAVADKGKELLEGIMASLTSPMKPL